MKNIFLSTLLLIAFTLVACDRDENQQGSIDKQNAVSISQVILPPSGGTQTFTVTSDADWEITYSSGIGEIDVSPNTGTAGTKEVKCEAKYAPNKDINVIMYFKYSNGETFAEIPLIQKKPILEIKNSEDASDLESKEFNWYEPEANGKYSFVIYSNTDWRFTNNIPDWLEVVIADNDDNNTEFIYPDGSKEFNEISKNVTIKPKNFNLDEGERKNTLTIKSGSGTKNLTFSQPNKTLVAKAENEVGGNIESLQFKSCNDSDTPIIVRSAFDEWKLSTENLPKGDWFSSESGGKGDTDVTITPQANYSREPIHGYINIEGTADGKTGTREIPVKIDEYILTFSLTDQNEETVAVSIPKGQSHNINWLTHSFRSSGAWKIEPDKDSWLEINEDKLEGKGNGTLYYRPKDENLNIIEDRTSDVTLQSKDNNLKAILSVTQKHFNFGVESDNIELQERSDKDTDEKIYEAVLDPLDTKQHTIKVICDKIDLDKKGWSYTDNNANWIKDEEEDTQVKFTATENTGEERSYVLVIRSNIHGNVKNDKYGYKPIQITIKQEKFVFDTEYAEIKDMDAIPTQGYEITLGKSMGKWKVEKPDWISVNLEEGEGGNKAIIITPKNNIVDIPQPDGRTGIVKIISQKNTNLVKEITVHQEAHWLIGSTETVAIQANPSKPSEITIQCAADWEVTADQEWISLSPTKGSGDGSFTISADENKDKDKRTATVTVTSRGKVWSIDVTQAGTGK